MDDASSDIMARMVAVSIGLQDVHAEGWSGDLHRLEGPKSVQSSNGH